MNNRSVVPEKHIIYQQKQFRQLRENIYRAIQHRRHNGKVQPAENYARVKQLDDKIQRETANHQHGTQYSESRLGNHSRNRRESETEERDDTEQSAGTACSDLGKKIDMVRAEQQKSRRRHNIDKRSDFVDFVDFQI